MPGKTLFILVLLLLLAACAAPMTDAPVPVAGNPPVAESDPRPEVQSEPEAGFVQALDAPELVGSQPESQPAPISRGDALVATDPALVDLTAGRPVLVEFFRFT